MDLALIASAGLIGLAGVPHCAAMCGAPCGALMGAGLQRPAAISAVPAGTALRSPGPSGIALIGPAWAAFMVGRGASYMLGGAVVAAGVGVLSAMASWAPALRPLWTAAHAATLLLGGWMLLKGQLPRWPGWARRAPATAPAPASSGWQPIAGPHLGATRSTLCAGLAGSAWVVMPCGLLQSALIVAALASTPGQGAAAMGAFALTSSIGLVAWPALALQPGADQRRVGWALRASGALLVAASGWALGHGLWQRVAAFCSTA